ncbi:hypothetical protein AAEO57_18865 [Flavobacterium sp. DGU38]|uniref:DKNYY family protein n=1 Tax=Flavobacterium calami TaxID=3139144 RepID=A0ABU9IVG8_9FLAO
MYINDLFSTAFKKNKIMFIFLIILSSCTEKEGKDKYPEIPEFPKTINAKIKFKKIFGIGGTQFYNDSLLIKFSGDTIALYDIAKRKTSEMKGYYICYEDDQFLLSSSEGYFTIDDTNFKKRSIDSYNEYSKFNSISDSLRKKRTNPNSDINEKQLDSIYLNFFCNKYKIDNKTKPYKAVELGNRSYLIQTRNNKFVLNDTPSCLVTFFDENAQKMKSNIGNLKKMQDAEYEKSYFEVYDYAMIHKFWTSSGGGNHFIPSIPYMDEAGYYYIKYEINNSRGNFKVLSYDNVTFHDLTKIKDDRFLTYAPDGIYEVVLHDN